VLHDAVARRHLRALERAARHADPGRMARARRRTHRRRARRSRTDRDGEPVAAGRVQLMERARPEPDRSGRFRPARTPPRLLTRTVAVTFGAVALLLAIVFVVVTLTVRNEVRQSVASQLESSQRMFAALEGRRLRELQAQAATIADSPTLVAALDTLQVEAAAQSVAGNSEAIE